MRKRTDRLYKRGTRWYADLRDFGAGRIPLRPAGERMGTKDRDVATKILGETLRDLEDATRRRHLTGQQRSVGLGQACEMFLEHRRGTDVRESTLRRSDLAFVHVSQVFDTSIHVEDVTPALGGACDRITFNPLVLPQGMKASADPVLLARPAPYAISFGRRLGEAPR